MLGGWNTGCLGVLQKFRNELPEGPVVLITAMVGRAGGLPSIYVAKADFEHVYKLLEGTIDGLEGG